MKPFVMMAPMEGVVDHVTRQIYSLVGGYDRFVTEFIRVTDRRVSDSVFLEYCPELKSGGKTKEGIPVYVQLLGGIPEFVAESASGAADLGALGIDLNFGCPARTVNRHDGGATLLKHPRRLFDVIRAVRKSVPLQIPVTAKVRLGFSDKNYVLDIASAVNEGGASQLTVHARTRDEGYKPPAHWEYIGRMKEVMTIPVIANGEIWTVEDYRRCVAVSGCTSVALGRGALATPDLAHQIKGKTDTMDWEFVRSTLLRDFMERSQAQVNPRYMVARTKQWLKYLALGYLEGRLKFDEIKTKTDPMEITNSL